MVLIDVDRIGTREIVGLLVDFLTESRPGVVNRRPRKGKGDEPKRGNVLSPTSPYRLSHELGAICVTSAPPAESAGRAGLTGSSNDLSWGFALPAL